MPLFESAPQEELWARVAPEAIEALADLLLEVLQGTQRRDGAGDESEDHA
jgi:hypothetical protein